MADRPDGDPPPREEDAELRPSRRPTDPSEGGSGDAEDGKRKPPFSGQSLLLVGFVTLFVMWAVSASNAPTSHGKEISYSDFLAQLNARNVATARITGQYITGELRPPAGPPEKSAEQDVNDDGVFAPRGTPFHVVLPPLAEDRLLDRMEEAGVEFDSDATPSVTFGQLLVSLLPIILLVWLFFFLMRRTSDPMGQGGMFGNFVRSPAKRFAPDDKHATYDDVAGLKFAKGELTEVVEFLKTPEKFEKIGAEIPKGILLSGPPGTGKTLLARATAGEAGVPFFSINGSEFIQMFVGVGASRVRDMFATAKKAAPCILFVDEIDAVGRIRGAGVGGGHDEREQTLNQILSEMDGFQKSETVIVLAATNRPDVLDPALLRPGRFDRKVEVDLPSREGRVGILKVHSRDVPLDEKVKLDDIAASTMGFAGADLKNLVNEAALHAVRSDREVVTPVDFEDAYDKITLGGPRAEKISAHERRMTAYHEAGHALVGWLSPELDSLHKVTIVPRGRTGGVTHFLPDEEAGTQSESKLHAQLTMMMGGRAAEEVVFGEVTTGASNDIKRATQVARAMVGKCGMSDAVGPVAFDQSEEHPFLGREMHDPPRNYSDETARLLDSEVQKFLHDADQRARDLCTTHRDKLDAIADLLLENEVVSADDVAAAIGPAVPRRRVDSAPLNDLAETNGHVSEEAPQAAVAD